MASRTLSQLCCRAAWAGFYRNALGDRAVRDLLAGNGELGDRVLKLDPTTDKEKREELRRVIGERVEALSAMYRLRMVPEEKGFQDLCTLLRKDPAVMSAEEQKFVAAILKVREYSDREPIPH